MKTRILIACLLIFVSLKAVSQGKYAVEFVAGTNIPGLGVSQDDRYSYGVTVGLGVSIVGGRDVEIVGNTLFTYFPQSKTSWRAVPIPRDIIVPQMSNERSYSCDVLVGARFHGFGSMFVHPFLLVQGGMQLLRTVPSESVYYDPLLRSNSSFMRIHGTEDIQLNAVVNVGGGLQFVPMHSLLINLQASYKILIGSGSTINSLIPVVVSIQLPT